MQHYSHTLLPTKMLVSWILVDLNPLTPETGRARQGPEADDGSGLRDVLYHLELCKLQCWMGRDC
jgi:hypothetical protein